MTTRRIVLTIMDLDKFEVDELVEAFDQGGKCIKLDALEVLTLENCDVEVY